MREEDGATDSPCNVNPHWTFINKERVDLAKKNIPNLISVSFFYPLQKLYFICFV